MRRTGTRWRANSDTSHLRRHDLRHTGLTWMADAGVSLHVLQKIAGHADSRTTERYLHPDRREVTGAGDKSPDTCGPVLVPLSVLPAETEIPSDRGRRGFSICRADRI
ncbi:tyrosine-type recombinase/integrase [Nocardia nova]|uniref:tyrosine-type recombinase/integrase n=1 Tax=Nocardia nova TaxID=37330 RepID=UPI0033DF4AD8